MGRNLALRQASLPWPAYFRPPFRVRNRSDVERDMVEVPIWGVDVVMRLTITRMACARRFWPDFEFDAAALDFDSATYVSLVAGARRCPLCYVKVMVEFIPAPAATSLPRLARHRPIRTAVAGSGRRVRRPADTAAVSGRIPPLALNAPLPSLAGGVRVRSPILSLGRSQEEPRPGGMGTKSRPQRQPLHLLPERMPPGQRDLG